MHELQQHSMIYECLRTSFKLMIFSFFFSAEFLIKMCSSPVFIFSTCSLISPFFDEKYRRSRKKFKSIDLNNRNQWHKQNCRCLPSRGNNNKKNTFSRTKVAIEKRNEKKYTPYLIAQTEQSICKFYVNNLFSTVCN